MDKTSIKVEFLYIESSALKKFISVKGGKPQIFALKRILFWSNYSLGNLYIMTLLPNSPRLHCILFTHFSCSNFILCFMLKSLLLNSALTPSFQIGKVFLICIFMWDFSFLLILLENTVTKITCKMVICNLKMLFHFVTL